MTSRTGALGRLLACLGSVRAVGSGRFVADADGARADRVYGGRLLAQTLRAAGVGCPGRVVQSIHTLFPRAGRGDRALHLDVAALHDGASLASRRVEVWQDEGGERRLVASSAVLLHAPEAGPRHEIAAPAVGSPADAPPIALELVPGEARTVGGVDLRDRATGPAAFQLWVRAADAPDDPELGPALVAWVSDWPVIGTLLRPLPGLAEGDSPERIQTAPVSHTVWFHRAVDARSWLLFCVEGSCLGRGRGFGRGHVFAESGALVASFAQESVIRAR